MPRFLWQTAGQCTNYSELDELLISSFRSIFVCTNKPSSRLTRLEEEEENIRIDWTSRRVYQLKVKYAFRLNCGAVYV